MEGWELRSYPSTGVRSTLSRYIGGDSGGIGSVTLGRLQEAGTIKVADVLMVENPPRKFRFEEDETRKVHQTYGTNGITTPITLRLTPKRETSTPIGRWCRAKQRQSRQTQIRCRNR